MTERAPATHLCGRLPAPPPTKGVALKVVYYELFIKYFFPLYHKLQFFL